ncbi:hypothetical protein [Tenacibaculum maritimum]|uniref:hypothetical protein n=1 Tax=Tenacibaculum maritimum TaxID=107401 RepID=UPI0038905524
MAKLTLRRIFTQRKADKEINGFQYFEIPLGKEGIIFHVSDQSYTTEPMYSFAQFQNVLEKYKKDMSHPVDVRNALANVKWSYINYEQLKTIQTVPKGSFHDAWGVWKNEGGDFLVKEYGIQKQYTQAKKVKVSSKDKAQLGNIYWIEAYNLYPEFDKPKLGAFVAFTGKPQVLRTDFYRNKEDIQQKGIYKYNDEVILSIKTHLLPDVTTPYHDFAVFEIDIYEYYTDIKVTQEPIRYVQEQTDNQIAYNTNNLIPIKIDEVWREATEHERETPIKYFYAKIRVLHYKNKDAALGNKWEPIRTNLLSSHVVGSKVPVIAPNGEQVVVEINKEDWAKKKFYQISISESEIEDAANVYTEKVIEEYDTNKAGKGLYSFGVYYNTNSELLGQRTFEMQKMIAEVVERQYTVKNNEPCKFSAIQVSVNGGSSEEIFNEHSITTKQADNNINLFEMIASDHKKEKVTIVLDCLEAQHYQSEGKAKPRCHGIGLPPGEKHNETNIFDTESFSKQWLNSKNYTIKENRIDIEIGYKYDRTVAQGTVIENGVLNKLWFFNYFWLKDTQIQSYAIPISTCRYSNQIVKINVYPDITWGITLTFGSNASAYSDDWRKDITEDRKETLKERKKYIEAKVEKVTPYTGFPKKPNPNAEVEKVLSKLKIEFGVNVKYGDEVIAYGLSDIESLQTLIYTFGKAMSFFDNLTGNGVDEKTKKTKFEERQQKIQEKYRNKFLGKLAKVPITITVDKPSFALEATWGQSVDKNKFSRNIDLFFKASPLVKASGKLDLINCCTLIPFAGQVIKLADLILEYAGVTPSCFIELVGEISFEMSMSCKLGNKPNELKENLDGKLKLRIEASVTIGGGGLAGFIFVVANGDVTSYYDQNTYKATGETGFVGNVAQGVDGEGFYLENNLTFLGLEFKATKEKEQKRKGDGMVGKLPEGVSKKYNLKNQSLSHKKSETIATFTAIKAKEILKSKRYITQ